MNAMVLPWVNTMGYHKLIIDFYFIFYYQVNMFNIHPFLLLITKPRQGSNIFSLYASLHITIFDPSRGLVDPE